MGSPSEQLDYEDDLLEQFINYYKIDSRKHPQETEDRLHTINQKENRKPNKCTQSHDSKSMSGDSSQLQSNKKNELLRAWFHSTKFIDGLDANLRSRLKSNRKPELVKPPLKSTKSTENSITKKNTARQKSVHSTSSRLPKSNKKTELVKPSLESTTDSQTGNSITKKNTPKPNSEHSTSNRSLNLNEKSKYSDRLLLSIKTWIESLDEYKNTLSRVFIEDFNQLDSEPSKGSCFNYFLLDPRITNNFPGKNKNRSLKISWETFLSGIFYIGKGKSDRPYDHLKKALKESRSNDPSKKHGKKIQTILDIWNEGKGVVILQVFERKVDLESFTREAAMIEVIGTRNLANEKNGSYHGQISMWKSEEKHKVGRYLLYESYQKYLISKPVPEIFPLDL